MERTGRRVKVSEHIHQKQILLPIHMHLVNLTDSLPPSLTGVLSLGAAGSAGSAGHGSYLLSAAALDRVNTKPSRAGA